MGEFTQQGMKTTERAWRNANVEDVEHAGQQTSRGIWRNGLTREVEHQCDPRQRQAPQELVEWMREVILHVHSAPGFR